MEMTEFEIIRSYRTSADQKKQIIILAELNDCRRSAIKEILERNNVTERRKRPARGRTTDKDVVENPAKFDAFMKSLMDKHLGETFQQIADQIGLSRTAISNYVNGYTLPSRGTFERLLKFYGITREEYRSGRNV